ncbi:glycohydrolase toxin TNT-related protein [Agromyces neolithicus]|uniref:Tox-PL domain-containing protein n=1 Tax=Agromyces neolithicus TaxID=269420 RepID=A0ABN2M5Z8_9MICO
MASVQLDPARLVTDGDSLYGIANSLSQAVRACESALGSTGGMAGDEESAQVFAQGQDGEPGYDQYAVDVLKGALGIANSLKVVDAALGNSARAYDGAQLVGAFKPASSSSFPEATATISEPSASVPTALGKGPETPLGEFGEFLQDALAKIGVMLPDADTGKLGNAESAWNTLSGDITRIQGQVDAGFTNVSAMTLPQKQSMLSCQRSLSTTLGKVSESASSMGGFARSMIDSVNKAWEEIGWFIAQMAVEIAIEIGLGALLGAVTFGAGAAAMALKIATTVMRWALKIAALCKKLRMLVMAALRMARMAIRAGAMVIRETLSAGLASAITTASFNQVRGALDPNYQPQNVLNAALSAAAGGAAGGGASRIGGRLTSNVNPGALQRLTHVGVETGGGAIDGLVSGAAESGLNGTPFSPLSSMAAGALLGGALAGRPGGNAGSAPTSPTGPGGNGAGSNVDSPDLSGIPTGGTGAAGSNQGGANPVDVSNDAPTPGAGDAGTTPTGDGTSVDVPSDAPTPGSGDAGTPAGGDGPGIDLPSADAPTTPDLPSTPDAGTPDVPSAPDAGSPDVPSAPDAGTPDAPSSPDAGTPDVPSTPDAPSAPDAPTTPDVPSAPDGGTPDAPSTPDAPVTPDAGTPDGASAPEAPNSTDAPSAPDASTPDAPTASDAGAHDAARPEASAPDAPTAPEAPVDAQSGPGSDSPVAAATGAGSSKPAADATAPDAHGTEADAPDADSSADTVDGSKPVDGPEPDEVAAAGGAAAAAGGAALLSKPAGLGAKPTTPSAPNAPDANTPADANTPDGSTPDANTPDASTPDGSTPDGSTPDDGTPADGPEGTPDTTANNRTERTPHEILQALGEINPNYDPSDPSNGYATNCGNTSANMNDFFNGSPTAEAPTGTLDIAQMEARTGNPQTPMTPDQIEASLRALGPGSHCVVGIDRSHGDGHWFNAYFDGTNVWVVDAQPGTMSPWPPNEPNATTWDASIPPEHVAPAAPPTSTATTPDVSSPDAAAPDATAPTATAPDATAPAATAPDASAPNTTVPASEPATMGDRSTSPDPATPADGPGDPVLSGADNGPGWERVPDRTPHNPIDPNYGDVRAPAESGHLADPYAHPGTVPNEIAHLITDPDAPYGRGPDGSPFTREQWEARYTNADGRPIYPGNDGGTPGSFVEFHDLDAFIANYGDLLDRMGGPAGDFLSFPGTPFEHRALPPSNLSSPYFTYEFGGSMPAGTRIEVSEIAPAFGRDGGGLQVRILDADGNPMPVDELLDRGILHQTEVDGPSRASSPEAQAPHTGTPDAPAGDAPAERGATTRGSAQSIDAMLAELDAELASRGIDSDAPIPDDVRAEIERESRIDAAGEGLTPAGSLSTPNSPQTDGLDGPELARELRDLTPTDELRVMVNQASPGHDPIYTNVSATTLHADHIHPLVQIVDMPGFRDLTWPQMLEVVNLADNFVGLEGGSNSSKGGRTFAEWFAAGGHQGRPPVPAHVAAAWSRIGEQSEAALQAHIDELLRG